MKTIKPKQVNAFLKNNKKAKIIYSDSMSADRNKIKQILKSADRVILIFEKPKYRCCSGNERCNP